jgi:hypothetical protein
MSLETFDSWLQDASTYWTNEINNSTFANKDDLLNSLNNYLSQLSNGKNSFIDRFDSKLFKRTIRAFATYIVIKYGREINVEGLTVKDVNIDFTSFLGYWNIELPDHTLLFELQEDSNPENGILNVTDTYNGFLNTLQSYDDNALMQGKIQEVVEATDDFFTYLQLVGDTGIQPIQNFNPDYDSYMNYKKVCDAYNITLPGVYP